MYVTFRTPTLLHKALHECFSSTQITLSSENLKNKIQNMYSNFLCFYGCETRSVALREEHGIKMCGNKEKMGEQEEDRK
jgi:hypothetical protein